MDTQRPYELVLFGATGFTGRLTAVYLAEHAGDLRWAIAGRNRDKLEAVKRELHGSAPDIIEANINDPAPLVAMAEQTQVVLTTVGPYASYGEPLVKACVEAGAHYADITGEPDFVSRMVEVYDADARERGVKIVNCCGFDSIPHDLGALLTVRALPRTEPITVNGYVRARGGFSGGTWQSAIRAFDKMSLKSGGPRPPRTDSDRKVRRAPEKVRYEPAIKAWVAPLPTIDGTIVRRSARALPDYGPDFRYGHHVRMGSITNVALGGAAVGSLFALSKLGPTRKLLLSYKSSGDGPSERQREKSWFRVIMIGEGGGKRARVEVRGGDPGYTETAKMLGETGLCLARDGDRLPEYTGVITPAVAMGDPLIDRLRAAGISLELIDDPNA